ncbi:MAG: hypothetical protein V4543_03860 [Bacteroidota bacterium]
MAAFIGSLYGLIFNSDKNKAMDYGAVAGLIAAQLLFGLLFIRFKGGLKYLLIIFLPIPALSLTYYCAANSPFRGHSDVYGYTDIVIIALLANTLVLEQYYRIEQYILNRKPAG